VITETTRPAQLGADTAPAADSYVHLRVCVAGRRSMRSNTERPTSVGAQPGGGDARPLTLNMRGARQRAPGVGIGPIRMRAAEPGARIPGARLDIICCNR